MGTLKKAVIAKGIMEVRLNRPESLNAMTPELLGEITTAFRKLNQDRETRAVILSGEGKGFCSGADLKQDSKIGAIPGTEGMSQLGFIYKYQEYLADAILAIHECDKPVIAAINGVAVGGGFALTLACDLRIASTKAKFGAVFIKTGLSSCDVGTSYFLPKYIGPTKALELMLTGRIFDAEEAAALGLLNAVVEPDKLLDEATTLAANIAENAEYGVWMTKKGFWANMDAPTLRHAMEIENRQQVLGCFTGCIEETMAAFQEGRQPKWKKL